MDRVTSFSIKESDEEAQKVVNETKDYAKHNGIRFSFIIVKALMLYREQVIKGESS